jgi:hypothetical protein
MVEERRERPKVRGKEEAVSTSGYLLERSVLVSCGLACLDAFEQRRYVFGGAHVIARLLQVDQALENIVAVVGRAANNDEFLSTRIKHKAAQGSGGEP